ncbi:glycoside hydrolase superfamily [Coemansia mojavensis]|nr:glycoside hydrolase superfamily [Coemansia mojavensis]
MQLDTFPTFDPVKAQVFRFRKLYGVNLGSMFCLEPWIATELYKDYQQHSPEAECDLLECMGDEACEKMEAHWNSWLQRADFEKMASMGINSVRLPVGYWVLGRHFTMGKYASYKGVYDNALSHISRIISWAAEFDIGVLIDIHALPGGQNNDSHSGTTGTACFYDNPEFQHLAIKCYGVFAHLLANITNVIGLQIINEPLDHPQLEDFYKQALSEIRLQTTDLPIYIGDAWNLTKYAKIAKELSQQFGFIVVDTHRYWVFRPQKQQYRVDRLTKELWETTFPELSQASYEASGNLVIGEYSSVLANGSFDGEDPAECMGKFAREQLKAFDQVAAGTFYWTWRLQHDSWFWSMQFAINANAMPSIYFPFGWSPDKCSVDVIKGAENHRNIWRERRLNGHKQYVSQWDGEFGFDHYEAGFNQGLDVAKVFFSSLSYPSKLGFVRQLALQYAAEYVKQNGGKQWEWEYIDGFREAQEEFDDYCCSLYSEV